MKQKQAFTLLELIVVVTILSILWVISFISIQSYVQDSRNSKRIWDLATIETSLRVYFAEFNNYPLPSDATDISYSGWVVWNQWYFWDTTVRNVDNISRKPVDPLLESEYVYSTVTNRSSYELWALLEWNFVVYNPITPQVYANTLNSPHIYMTGNYNWFDAVSRVWNNCTILAVPSLFMDNVPLSNEITLNTPYQFSYNWWTNFPDQYTQSTNAQSLGIDFEIWEVYNKCEVDNLIDLNEYISRLSIVYQQYENIPQYEDLIFNSTLSNFKEEASRNLDRNSIRVPESIIQDIRRASVTYRFTDTFEGSTLQLAWRIINWNNWGIWNETATGSYWIVWSRLQKLDSTNNAIIADPIFWISSPDMWVLFDVIDFAWGDIIGYLRYTDASNYYALRLSPSWYQIIRRVWWSDVIPINASHTFSPWDTVFFSITWDTINFSLNGQTQETFVDDSWVLTSIGIPQFFIQNNGATIDNYSLTYK